METELTFSQEAKVELCAIDPNNKRVIEIGLAAAFMDIGQISAKTAKLRIGFAPFADLIIKNIRYLYDIQPLFTQMNGMKLIEFPRGEIYQKFYDFLVKEMQFNPLRGQCSLSANSLTEVERRTVLRYFFLSFGSVTYPQKSYYLELGFRRPTVAQFAYDLLQLEGLPAHRVVRGRSHRIFIKECQAISDFLAITGAHGSMLKFEAWRVEKEMRNTINRIVNCDSANMKRVAETAVAQVDALRRLQTVHDFDTLPHELKELAILRLENPDLSLRELGELLQPSISKSGVSHRMSRLLKMAKDLPK